MNIIPISAFPIQTSSVPGVSNAPDAAKNIPFKDLFQNALNNLEEVNAVKERDSIRLALGEVDDLAEITINSQRAEIAMQLLMQVRNRALDAYQEIMRINV